MRSFWLAMLMSLTTLMAGCELIGNIFQAGFAVGAVVMILIFAGVAFLVMKAKG